MIIAFVPLGNSAPLHIIVAQQTLLSYANDGFLILCFCGNQENPSSWKIETPLNFVNAVDLCFKKEGGNVFIY